MKALLLVILTLGSISSYANCDIALSAADIQERAPVGKKMIKKLKKTLKRQGYTAYTVDESILFSNFDKPFVIFSMYPVTGGYQLGMAYRLKDQNVKVTLLKDKIESYFPKCE